MRSFRIRYVSVLDTRNSGAVKASTINFPHTFTSSKVLSTQHFQVIDNPARLALPDWTRVLAVFTIGAAWQFKGWKWDTPVDLFQHLLGFHLHYDQDSAKVAASPVGTWNVMRLAVSQSKRHLDATTVRQFWERVEQFLVTKRPQQQ